MTIIESLENIKKNITKLTKAKKDPSCLQGDNPYNLIDVLEKQFIDIKNDIESFLSNQPEYNIENVRAATKPIKECLENLYANFTTLKEFFNYYDKDYILKEAREYYKEYKAVLETCEDSFEEMDNLKILKEQLDVKLKKCPDFGKIITFNNWNKLKSISQNKSSNVLQKTQHNSLSFVLNSSDEDFLNAFGIDISDNKDNKDNKDTNYSKMSIMSNEVYFIAIDRLKDMYKKYLQEGNIRYSIKILKFINDVKKHLFLEYNPFAINEEEFINEFIKLKLHSKIHPDNKIVWLGTAQYVADIIKNPKYIGAYLNSSDEKGRWTWQLNRAYLLLAANMGFDIHILEPEFPNVKDAILSKDTAKFINSLSNYIRVNKDTSPKNTKHHGETEPTATYHEILFLMNMGYKPFPIGSTVYFTKEQKLSSDYELSNQNAKHFDYSEDNPLLNSFHADLEEKNPYVASITKTQKPMLLEQFKSSQDIRSDLNKVFEEEDFEEETLNNDNKENTFKKLGT